MTPTPLHVLIVEDSADDAELLLRELRRGGYGPVCERVETVAAMQAALTRQTWDLVVSDHSVLQFDSLAALNVLKASRADIPFIIVSGTIGEELAVQAMKAGASDYLVKGKLARLIPVVGRELADAQARRARRAAEQALFAIVSSRPCWNWQLRTKRRWRAGPEHSICATGKPKDTAGA